MKASTHFHWYSDCQDAGWLPLQAQQLARYPGQVNCETCIREMQAHGIRLAP